MDFLNIKINVHKKNFLKKIMLEEKEQHLKEQKVEKVEKEYYELREGLVKYKYIPGNN